MSNYTIKVDGLDLFSFLVTESKKHPIEAIKVMRKHGQDLAWWDELENKAQFLQKVRQWQKANVC
tara:strand:+ start:508 stop:702 length:195 start_codon:yes stop_codon:yes gene_type:complete